MLGLNRLFASQSPLLKNGQKAVVSVNALEEAMRARSDEALKEITVDLKMRLLNGAVLESDVPEAFAAARGTARRSLRERHYDVQLIGGNVLHHRAIAEMKTGEGKTLVATLPAYLNALSGKGVHIVTVNDYLARRDAVWMGQIYDERV